MMDKPQEDFMENGSSVSADNGTEGDQDEETNPLSPEDWRILVHDLLNNHLTAVETAINNAIPSKSNSREKLLEPFKKATTEIKAAIDNLSYYGLVSQELSKSLERLGIRNSETLERIFHFASKLKNQWEDLTMLTQSATREEASDAIHEVYDGISKFSTQMGTPFTQWTGTLQSILEENEQLKGKLAEMETKQNLLESTERFDRRTPTPSESLLNMENRSGREDQTRRRAELNNQYRQSEQPFYSRAYGDVGLPYNSVTYDIALRKSQALPEIKPYTGRGDRTFNEFLEELDHKYPVQIFDEYERRSLLVKLLEQKALDRFKSLDKEVQKGRLSVIIEKMKALMKEDSQVNSTLAYQKLVVLKLDSEPNLNTYCDKLERWTREAHPSLNDPELNGIRANHLLQQVIFWPGGDDALSIVTKGKTETMYGELKELVYQWDRIKKARQILDQAAHPSDRNNFQKLTNNSNYQQRPYRGQDQQNNHLQPNQGTCHKCGEEGHYRHECPRRLNTEGRQQYQSSPPWNTDQSQQDQQQYQDNSNISRQNTGPQNVQPNNRQYPQPNRNNIEWRDDVRRVQDPQELAAKMSTMSILPQVKKISSNNVQRLGNRSIHDVCASEAQETYHTSTMRLHESKTPDDDHRDVDTQQIVAGKTTAEELDAPSRAWDQVQVSFIKQPAGSFSIVVFDKFSASSEERTCRGITATRIVRVLEDIFQHKGKPNVVITGKGSQFRSATFRDFCFLNNIHHYATSIGWNEKIGGDLKIRIGRSSNQSYQNRDSRCHRQPTHAASHRPQMQDGRHRSQFSRHQMDSYAPKDEHTPVERLRRGRGMYSKRRHQ